MPRTPKRAGRVPRPDSRFLADALAENVRARRVLAKWSQAVLAKGMEILGHDWTQTTVSDVERGERNVTVDELLGLALLFNISPPELLDPRGTDRQNRTLVDLGGPGLLTAEDASAWLRDQRQVGLARTEEGRPGTVIGMAGSAGAEG